MDEKSLDVAAEVAKRADLASERKTDLSPTLRINAIMQKNFKMNNCFYKMIENQQPHAVITANVEALKSWPVLKDIKLFRCHQTYELFKIPTKL